MSNGGTKQRPDPSRWWEVIRTLCSIGQLTLRALDFWRNQL